MHNPVGPKHGHETVKQKVEDTEEANLAFRSFIGCSEIVGSTLRPLIPTTSEGVSSKKRKFDVRTGGGKKDGATHSINKISRVSGQIIKTIGSRSETLVIHPHKKTRHMK